MAIRYLRKLCEDLKVFCTLLRAVNVNWTMKQYYYRTQREIYGGKYPDSRYSFMGPVSRHTLSKLFQLYTGRGVLDKIVPNEAHQRAKPLL